MNLIRDGPLGSNPSFAPEKILIEFNPECAYNAHEYANQVMHGSDGCQFEKRLQGFDKID